MVENSLREKQAQRNYNPWVLAVIAIGGIVIGALLGGWIVRRRHDSREVVAAVNGTTIKQGEFFARLQKAAGPATIHSMVEDELRRQYARKLNVYPTDADVDARIKHLQSMPGFDQQLAANGETIQDLRRAIELQLARANVVAKGITVTDSEVQSYYRDQSNPSNPSASYYRPARADIQAIITRSHDKIAQAQSDLLNGLPFELIAQKYSEDPSSKNGGAFPPIIRNGSKLSQVPGFESNVFSLAIGQRSDPVKIGGAWWIIRCNDKTPAKTTPFADVQDECKLGARVAKGMKISGNDIEQKFKQFQQSSSIQAFWPQYESTLKQ